MKTRVLVLGGTGMLGSMVATVLSRESCFELTIGVRDLAVASRFRARLPGVHWLAFDAEGELGQLLERGGQPEWIVNAIGITKPLIREEHPGEVSRAISINAAFPYRLARWAEERGTRVLQIATDCVYAGTERGYVETHPHDAHDVYGKTKSLGEVRSPTMHHLRCSIIGPEPKDFKFLVEWFRRQPRNARVNGFVNHEWNGITTLQFARICRGIIAQKITLPHLQHVVPSDSATKAELLRMVAETYDRLDVQIVDANAPKTVTYVLDTRDQELNKNLWRAAGYDAPPSLRAAIAEMSRHEPLV